MHLKVRHRDWLNDGKERAGVYLDMETMWNKLNAYFKKLTAALRWDERLSRQVMRQGRRLDQKYIVTANPESLDTWRAFLAANRVDSPSHASHTGTSSQ